jgi:hypothetical protein
MMIGAIGFALLNAAPMSPEEIEELLSQVNVPKIAYTLRQQSDDGDPPPSDEPENFP